MDLLTYRLTGSEPLIHPTNAAAWGAFDLTNSAFCYEVTDKLNIPRALFPKVASDYTVVGSYNANGRAIENCRKRLLHRLGKIKGRRQGNHSKAFCGRRDLQHKSNRMDVIGKRSISKTKTAGDFTYESDIRFVDGNVAN